MATAREFVTLALKEAGVIGVGQTPLAEDMDDSFTLLKRMLAQWQKKRWLVPYLYELTAAGNGQRSNQIGPGQYWNAARPDKIQAAFFRQVGGGDNAVDFRLTWVPSYEDYANIALKSLNSWPEYFFYDGAFPYGNLFIWPIPSADYEVTIICKGPIGFSTEIETTSIVNAGTLYTDGVYVAVPIQVVSGLGPRTSYGSGATANVTVAGGIITVVEIQAFGDGYRINDLLTINASDIGGTGSGFQFKVTKVKASLDSDFNMPEEYEEAIHFNLTKRLVAHYQYPANETQNQIAKTGLNTIRNANAQVPLLGMPRALRGMSRSTRFYIFNADAN